MKKIKIIVLCIILIFSFNSVVRAEEIYLGDDDETYTVNQDDTLYIQNLEEELQEKENTIYKQENKIELLESKLDKYKEETHYMWIGFAFILILAIYISYNLGLNKK